MGLSDRQPAPPEGEVLSSSPQIPDTTKARQTLANEPATGLAEAGENPETDPTKSGQLHAKYLARSKETDPAQTEQDRTTLKASKIEDIRYNHRLLVAQTDNETPQAIANNLKKETARRLQAYTDHQDQGWYTLNYSQMGRDTNGITHELGIGLGDILLDPDITDVLIEQNGQLIKAHRGTAASGQHKGRLGFLDKNNNYVATFTSDRFKILTDTETDTTNETALATYTEKVQAEEKIRADHKPSFQEEMREYTPLSETITYKEDATIAGTDITVNTLREAEVESATKAKSLNKLVARENVAKIVGFAAVKIGVPAEIIWTTMFRETKGRFDPNYDGDGGKALGLGHMHRPGWNKVINDSRFIEIMGPMVEEDPRSIERALSILADIVGIAITMKNAAEATGISMDHTTELSRQQLSDLRWYYHTPGYYSSIKKGETDPSEKERDYYGEALAFYDEKKIRYDAFADDALEIRSSARSFMPDNLA